jgi:hypothetical protein
MPKKDTTAEVLETIATMTDKDRAIAALVEKAAG